MMGHCDGAPLSRAPEAGRPGRSVIYCTRCNEIVRRGVPRWIVAELVRRWNGVLARHNESNS